MAQVSDPRSNRVSRTKMRAFRRPGRAEFLPFCRPSISEEEIEAVVDTLRSGWISTGPKTKQFEREFAAYAGVEEALALNSCTAGLHLALKVLGIGPGDQVITTPLTFCASANVIEHVGAETVLADVEPQTMNLDPGALERAITETTRAIVVVHLAGHPVNMREVLKIARDHGLYVVEDAAHALPAYYEGKFVGTLGDLAAFSFYATKNLTTAEGGMLIGAAPYLQKARILSLHGMNHDAWKRYGSEGSWWYEVEAPGYKYNMTDIQAALGLVQLRRLADLQARRLAIVAEYDAAFRRYAELETPCSTAAAVSSWHLYILRLNLDRLQVDRAAFMKQLAARNIGASVHFIPIHLHPYYRKKYGWAPRQFPVAFQEYQRTISLPMYPGMSDDDIADVITAVQDIVEIYRCPSVYSISWPAQH